MRFFHRKYCDDRIGSRRGVIIEYSERWEHCLSDDGKTKTVKRCGFGVIESINLLLSIEIGNHEYWLRVSVDRNYDACGMVKPLHRRFSVRLLRGKYKKEVSA